MKYESLLQNAVDTLPLNGSNFNSVLILKNEVEEIVAAVAPQLESTIPQWSTSFVKHLDTHFVHNSLCFILYIVLSLLVTLPLFLCPIKLFVG